MSPDAAHSGRAPRGALVVALAIVVVAATYARSLEGGFVWDDRHLIENAPLVQKLGALHDYFGAPFWMDREQGGDVRAYYRPIVTLSYALDHAVHGPNPAGFHLTNVLIHLVNVVLVFLLARRTGASPAAAGVAATTWGVLPRLAESVAWVSGRTDELAALFCFLAILVWRRRGGAWLGAVFVGLGLLSKELAVAALLGLCAEAWWSRERPRRAALLALVPAFVVTFGYVIVRARVLANAGRFAGLDAQTRATTALEAVGRYAMMAFDAWRPETQVGWVGAPAMPFVALGAALVPVAAWAIRHHRERVSPPIAGALATAAGAIALVLHLIPLPIGVVAADRFLYLPLAGVAIASAPALDRFFGRSRAAVAVVALTVGSLAVVGFQRTAVWGDEVALWLDAVEHRHPNNPLPLIELGNLEFRVGLYEDALASFEAAEAVDPKRGQVDRSIATSAAGNCLSALGRHSEAIVSLQDAAALRPDIPKFRLDLGLARLHALDYGGAKRDIGAALELHPDYAQAKRALALVDELEKMARDLPLPSATDVPGLRARARFETKSGRLLQATDSWLELVRRPDATLEDADEALELLVSRGSLEAALEVLERRKALGGPPPVAVLDALAYRAGVIQRLRRPAT